MPEPASRSGRNPADTRPGDVPDQVRAADEIPNPRPLRLAALAAAVIAVSASVVLPVAGTLAVAALITVLRAGNTARREQAARRGARGPRARDPFLVICSVPWVLVKSATETVLLAPLFLAAAGAAAAAVTFWLRNGHPLPAPASVAAAYTALTCLGPRSRAARRELNVILNFLASSPLAAAASMLSLGIAAMTIMGLALVKAPPLWPFPDVPSMHLHVPGLNPAGFHR